MNILIVDDQESTRNYLKRISSKSLGFGSSKSTSGQIIATNSELNVSEASNGLEALDLLYKQKYDLVFLDIDMPEMDGFEFLAQIRQNKNLESLHVVIITAHNDLETVKKLSELEVLDYIVKPLGYFDTIDRLNKIFNKIKSL